MRKFLTLPTLGLLVAASSAFGVAAPLAKATLRPAVAVPIATPKAAPSPKPTGTPAEATPSPKPTKAPHYIYVQYEATKAGSATGLDQKKSPSDVSQKWETLTSHAATDHSATGSSVRKTKPSVTLSRAIVAGNGATFPTKDTAFKEMRITDTKSTPDGKHNVIEIWTLTNAFVVAHDRVGKTESVTIEFEKITDANSTASTTVDDSWNAQDQ